MSETLSPVSGQIKSTEMSERGFQEIEPLAWAVRRAAEREFPQCKTLRNRCLLASYVLATMCDKRGLPAMPMMGFWRGRKHTWVECGVLIVDVTLTQFLRCAPPVVITDDWRDYEILSPAFPPVIKFDLQINNTYHHAMSIQSMAEIALRERRDRESTK